MKELVLVKFEANWADEFDVYGLAVYYRENWLKLCKRFKKAERHGSYYFGTNEGWDDVNEDGDWLDNYSAQVITEEEHNVLVNLGLGYKFGDFPCPFRLIRDWKDDKERDEYSNLTL